MGSGIIREQELSQFFILVPLGFTLLFGALSNALNVQFIPREGPRVMEKRVSGSGSGTPGLGNGWPAGSVRRSVRASRARRRFVPRRLRSASRRRSSSRHFPRHIDQLAELPATVAALGPGRRGARSRPGGRPRADGFGRRRCPGRAA